MLFDVVCSATFFSLSQTLCLSSHPLLSAPTLDFNNMHLSILTRDTIVLLLIVAATRTCCCGCASPTEHKMDNQMDELTDQMETVSECCRDNV